MPRWWRLAVMAAVVLLPVSHARASVSALDHMMAELAPLSLRSAETIRRVYSDHLELLRLTEYDALAGALDNGGLVPLPDDLLRFNLVPRLDGPSPIGELDLDNQRSYASARPATIGALIEIAAQVTAPIEVTSLVRHDGYQDALRTTNANANTAVPMHTMGLAADIAVLNMPIDAVYELRDVLLRMQEAGDILFIGERHQLVFHVVPHPTRLGYFNDVYRRSVGMPPTARFAEAVAFPARPIEIPSAALAPTVTTEIVAVLTAEGPMETLWVETAPPPPPAATPPARAEQAPREPWTPAVFDVAGSVGFMFLLAVGSVWALTRRPARVHPLFDR